MTDLAVLVPSRGRPHMMNRLVDAWTQTILGDTRLVIITDNDDDTDGYIRALAPLYADRPWLEHVVQQPRRLAATMNEWAPQYAIDCRHIGFTGDDHVPRTRGWDIAVTATINAHPVGVTYTNDLVHGAGLPTAMFYHGDIVRALGRMVPPEQVHLYLDNAGMQIGIALNSLHYLNEYVIEHMHPLVGKGDDDATYQAANAGALYIADEAAFGRWMDSGLAADIAAIKEYVATGAVGLRPATG